MAGSKIYISKEGEQFGPFSSDAILPLVENGHFSWDDPAWREGLEDWVSLREVFQDLNNGVLPRAPSEDAEGEEDSPSFFRELGRAFIYPLRGAGAWAILLFGTMLVIMMAGASVIPIIGLIAYVFLAGYYIAFLFKIIQETAIGEQEVAEFPGFQDIWDDVLRPFVQVSFASVACVFPSILAAGFVAEGPEELSWLPLVLLAAGLFYLPMVLLATVIFNSVFTALNPVLIIPAISRIFLRYLIIVLLLGAIVIGHNVLIDTLAEQLPWLAAFAVIGFAAFYIGIVQARILGLIYRTSKDEIGWFNR